MLPLAEEPEDLPAQEIEQLVDLLELSLSELRTVQNEE